MRLYAGWQPAGTRHRAHSGVPFPFEERKAAQRSYIIVLPLFHFSDIPRIPVNPKTPCLFRPQPLTHHTPPLTQQWHARGGFTICSLTHYRHGQNRGVLSSAAWLCGSASTCRFALGLLHCGQWLRKLGLVGVRRGGWGESGRRQEGREGGVVRPGAGCPGGGSLFRRVAVSAWGSRPAR